MFVAKYILFKNIKVCLIKTKKHPITLSASVLRLKVYLECDAVVKLQVYISHIGLLNVLYIQLIIISAYFDYQRRMYYAGDCCDPRNNKNINKMHICWN